MKLRMFAALLLCVGLSFGCDSDSDAGSAPDPSGHHPGIGDRNPDDQHQSDPQVPGRNMGADAGLNPNDGWSDQAGAGGGGGAAPGAEGEEGDDSGNGTAGQPWRQPSEDVQFAKVDLGGGNTLDLVRMRVTVQVEGLRARTLVDHVFYNPHDRAVEGTFKYPLPTEASVSYYGMFLGNQDVNVPVFFGPQDGLGELSSEQLVALDPEAIADHADPNLWGEFRVGRVVPAEKAREVYEEVTRRRIDPALVEEVAPNQFEARVFPIQARGYNRVIVAYEQTLPRYGNELSYAFPVPTGDINSFDFALTASDSAGEPRDASEVEEIVREDNESVLFTRSYEDEVTGGWIDLRFAQPEEEVVLDSVVGQVEGDSKAYFYSRLQAPAGMDGAVEAGGPRAVFMLDTSLSAHPDRFGVDVALLSAILEDNADIEEFAVMTFDVGARWMTDGMVENTQESRGRVISALEGVLLEGATNFGAALRELVEPPFATDGIGYVDVFLMSDGVINWGDGDARRLVAQTESVLPFGARFFAYRTGLGAENLELYQALTRRGAIFNCMTLDSIPACASAHTRPGMVLTSVTVEGEGEAPGSADEVLVAGRQATLFPGAQITIAGRVLNPGRANLRLVGHRNGIPSQMNVPLNLSGTGQLAPRAWAEVAVAQLLQTGDSDLERLAVALSQRYGVVNRAASLLVLETDAEYEIYGLEEERQKTGGEAITVLVELALIALGEGLSDWELLEKTLIAAADVHQVLEVDEGGLLSRLLDAGGGPEAFSIPRALVDSPLIRVADVPAAYVENLAARETSVFREEASRRHEAGETGGAIRALSSIIEANPGNPEAARLVGYRLGSWELDDVSAGIFFDILRRRPYEPQSYRDLAYAVQDERPALAALLFEAVLSGDWHARFLGLSEVAREEYALFVRRLSRRAPDSPLVRYLQARIAQLGIEIPRADIRVTMSWNTDNTDIDLWVTDPSGEKCYYANPSNRAGGQLLDDVTRGFGPERFQDVDGNAGEYVVQAHFFGNNGNRLAATTHIRLSVIKYAGTDDETVDVYTAVLDNPGDVVTLARISFDE